MLLFLSNILSELTAHYNSCFYEIYSLFISIDTNKSYEEIHLAYLLSKIYEIFNWFDFTKTLNVQDLINEKNLVF